MAQSDFAEKIEWHEMQKDNTGATGEAQGAYACGTVETQGACACGTVETQSAYAETVSGTQSTYTCRAIETQSACVDTASEAEALAAWNGLQIEPTDVMTGDRNRNRFLYYQLKMSMRKAEQIDIIVSFLMESGVRMILKDLQGALDRGVQVRILTGNYLGITQPSALCLIKKELGDRVDLRFYSDKKRSFHPKSYIFHWKEEGEIYIGSSNISRSALTSGIEWNYRFYSKDDPKNFQLFYDTFVDLFEHHSIVIDDAELARYSKHWHKPAVSKDLAHYDDVEEDLNTKVQLLFQPRGAQIEALYALEESRAEGATKGLVQAATGVGKTYLAAFDSASYQRVLFVAHREEILKQAAVSFRNVRQSDDYGFFYGQ